jgi:hypothetical protein
VRARADSLYAFISQPGSQQRPSTADGSVKS